MAENFQEKTEQPTDKRLEDSKKKGQVAQSRELSSSMIIMFSAIFFSFMMAQIFGEMFRIFISFVRNSNMEITVSNIQGIFSFGIYRWMLLVIPVFALLIFITIGGSVLQTGFMWSFEALKFNPAAMNPVEGIKKLFQKKSLVEVLKAIVKIVILGYIAYNFILKELPYIYSLSDKDIRSIIGYLGRTAFALTLKVGIVFLFIAGLDYLYQRWQHKKDLMMTLQEVKEEQKERDGNPQVKSRIRSLQREMARHRMINDVKTADVIVTNPTHFAVALKYKAGDMLAPKVVAKGAGFIAVRIKEVGAQFKVPIIENKPLARGLYYAVNVGNFIPEQFYLIVAELLAEVYKRKSRMRLS